MFGLYFLLIELDKVKVQPSEAGLESRTPFYDVKKLEDGPRLTL